MSKLEAIIHLYITGYITEERAFQFADSRGLSDEEKEQLRNEIERIKNPPVEEPIEETPEEPMEEPTEDTDDESTQDIPIE